ncbi:MAG: acyl-CoA dehydrogenase family protein [Burkholderiales bacterium]|nr:acyl-CoA dehydrogenase family protein [Burkholderiales bacterium]
MNLEYTAEEQAFREEVRRFVAEQVPEDVRHKVKNSLRLEREDFLRWQRALHARGWGAPSWPKDYGGPGWDAVQRHIFDEECAFGAAPPQPAFGLKMVAPVIMKFGTPEHKARFLPRIMDGTDWWCQGYSEPGAGSDLAGLSTRAVRDGDHYIVNGQKTWTTLAQHADWIFCLVRTDPEARKQEGISFLLIDMKSPGITVRPIIMLDGEHEVNEVWFDNVRVPVEQRVGDENKGWTCAKYLLGHERTGAAAIGASKAQLASLKKVAKRVPDDEGRPLIENPRFRDRLAQVELELMALEITNLKAIAAATSGKVQGPGAEASILKLRGSEIRQSLTELHMLALGPYAAPHLPEAMDASYNGEPLSEQHQGKDVAATGLYFNYRKTTIYGGSNEVQRGIIAKQVLGL